MDSNEVHPVVHGPGDGECMLWLMPRESMELIRECSHVYFFSVPEDALKALVLPAKGFVNKLVNGVDEACVVVVSVRDKVQVLGQSVHKDCNGYVISC